MHQLFALIKRFRADQKGAFGVIFGVMAVVLVATAGAAVDFSSIEQNRTRAQIALDAAALELQTLYYSQDEATLKSKAQQLLSERITDPGVTATVDSAVKVVNDGKLTLKATLVVPTSFVALVGVRSVTAHLTSETKRGSVNIEVALALDTTGSMAGSKIAALIDATKTLIPIVVKDDQLPTYSKLALVPYSNSVNLGADANAVRGTPIGPKAITGAAWSAGVVKNITGATKANPAVITSTAHGFLNGDIVYISGVVGMTQLNGKAYVVAGKTANTFQLQGINSSAYTKYTSGGTITKCLAAGCNVVITASAHGLATNDYVQIAGVNGMTGLNGQVLPVINLSANTYALNSFFGPGNSAYTSGGTSQCLQYGCQFFRFLNSSSGVNIFQVSTCVSDRTINALTDAAPSTTPLGMNYPAPANPCPAAQFFPLSTDKPALTTAANALVAGGSTGGQIGIAWSWFALSPNFASLWPAASQPASYTKPNLQKVAIIMTDGAYNSVYCSGVISQQSISGSGSSSDHINCNAPNGNPWTQAKDQCTAMKAAGIIVYTVGFDIDTDPNAIDVMDSCANDAAHAYKALTTAELKDAFKEIANKISSLRISH